MPQLSETSDNVKSRRPAESAFKQQRLPAWQPILTAGTVLPTFFVIGIAFIAVGTALLYFSNGVKEIVVDYTDCTPQNSVTPCSALIQNQSTCNCIISFNLTEDFPSSVYMYYQLTNYYQNHRRYVKSRDDQQLLGYLSETPSADCDPFTYEETANGRVPIAPCGAIANSMFNDVLTLRSLEGGPADVPLLRTGIAWPSDKNIKFQNPRSTTDLQQAFARFAKPKNWKKNIWELDLTDPSNNGFQNEDFIVWMRTAALPTFRKLYRRVDHSSPGFENFLLHGPYELNIEYNYDVTAFKGTKSMVLSTTSMLGGKNPFLGIAYIVVGCLCLVLGIVLLIIHVKCSKNTTEMINVNPRTPYS